MMDSFGAPGQICDFNHGEGFYVYLGKAHFQSAHQVEKIFKG